MLTASLGPPVPEKDRKGLLDQIEDLEKRRGKKKEAKPAKKSDDLDLGKIR